jgi:hypothetical protein
VTRINKIQQITLHFVGHINNWSITDNNTCHRTSVNAEMKATATVFDVTLLSRLWELSHYAEQRPKVSTRKGLNNINKLGCGQLRGRFVVVLNQQLQFSMFTIDNREYRSGTEQVPTSFSDINDYKDERGSFMVASQHMQTVR